MFYLGLSLVSSLWPVYPIKKQHILPSFRDFSGAGIESEKEVLLSFLSGDVALRNV